MIKWTPRIVKEEEKKVEKTMCVTHKDRECPKDYAHCITLYPECEYNTEKKTMENRVSSKEESNVKKSKLKWNKADIKCTVTGKFKIEVYPIIIDEEKMVSYALAIATVNRNKSNVTLNDHQIDHVRDLDNVKKWSFIGKTGDDVHADLMQYIINIFDDIVWECGFATEREFQKVRNSLTKSINKAIQKGSFSFGKLGTIIYGHQDIDITVKELVEQHVITDAEEYLSTFEDLKENVIVNDDSDESNTEQIRNEISREDAEDRMVSAEEEKEAVDTYIKEEENKYNWEEQKYEDED